MKLIHVPPTKWYNRTTWILVEDVEIVGYTVPKGFVTDGVSTPYLLSFIVSPTGKAMKSAILHDYLLSMTDKGESRIGCDKAFYDALIDDGISKWRAKIMYYAVRLYGIVKVSLC